ncbi:MAG TPA: ATP-dependent helicase, partial [Acidimicrobiales bacterium]
MDGESGDDAFGFTPEQLEAVDAPDRRVIVRAGAGAGKTRVLTRRVVRRITEEDVDPGQVLVATFTRKAAGELRTRLHAAGVEGVRAGTFHRAALELVREARDAQHRPAPVIAADRHRLFAMVAQELNLGLPAPALARLEAELSWAKARRLNAATYEAGARAARRRMPASAERMAAVLDAYDRLCRQRGVLDFDGLLEEATVLLERDTTARDAFRWRTRYLFVDELQDMNPAQFDLLCAMAGDDPDLFGVGDANQSIYGWNGADPHLLDVVASRWPPTRVLSLPRNHRSTDAIVRVATAALDQGPLDLVAATEGGALPTVLGFPDDEAEAAAVAAWCRSVRGPTRSWRQTAILARTNAALDALESACGAAGVPALRLGAEQSPASDLEADDARRWDTPEVPDAVVLSTIHRAKGLEWDHVAVTGLAEGSLPLGSASTTAQIDEERRLLYVAMTRPESELVLTWSSEHGAVARSRFLAPVDAELRVLAAERRPLEGEA